MAPDQSTSVLADTPLSRAGSLPQCFVYCLLSSSRKILPEVFQTHRASRVYDCCAAEREQAPSPQGICYRLRVRDTPQNLWELACSRWRPTSQHLCWLIHRYREQARSHSVLCIVCFHLCEKNCPKFSRHTAPVGSTTAAQPSGSKLPRHKGLVTASESGIHRRTCGSEPARDGARPVNISVG